jgi:exosortase E/protease (VPEID-CTERM system)
VPASHQVQSESVTSSDAALLIRWHPRGLLLRVIFLALLFTSELTVISIFLDGASLTGFRGLAGGIRDWGPWLLRAIVGLSALVVTFLWLKHRAALERISRELEEVPVAWGTLGLHAAAMAAFAALSAKLYGGSPPGSPNLLAGGWLIAGMAGIAFGAQAMLPWRYWLRLLETGGRLWAYASVAILLACVAGNISRLLWQPASYVTFTLVRLLLKPFMAGLFADPALLALGTRRFGVIIAPECSGLEGAGLILAFGAVWLLLFRRECRFPQSLALVLVGVVVLFLVNSVRIAALILIGDAGAPRIAMGGFHSQAGWILFNAVSVAFCLTIRSVPWFNAHGVNAHPRQHVARPRTAANPTAAYLIPFLAILAAGMVATAASSGFEWLYPLRMVAAAAALWVFRKRYATLNWRVSWWGAAAGVVVCLVWIAVDRFLNGSSPEHGAPSALLAVSAPVRTAWIVLRALAAVTTVPLAEELAFRGFLMRRFMTPNFESISPRGVTWFAILASSMVFGLLNGRLWVAGVFAGLLFALVFKRKGSMGDAVAAHATANALRAAYVLFYGQWHSW